MVHCLLDVLMICFISPPTVHDDCLRPSYLLWSWSLYMVCCHITDCFLYLPYKPNQWFIPENICHWNTDYNSHQRMVSGEIKPTWLKNTCFPWQDSNFSLASQMLSVLLKHIHCHTAWTLKAMKIVKMSQRSIPQVLQRLQEKPLCFALSSSLMACERMRVNSILIKFTAVS